MPSTRSRKRSNSGLLDLANLDSLTSQPPSKMQKSTNFDRNIFIKQHIQKVLAEFSSDQLRDLLVESAIKYPPVSESIHHFLKDHQAAKLAIPVREFSRYVPEVRKKLHDYYEPRGKIKGSMLEHVVGREIHEWVVKTVKQEILAKVDRDLCYETKYNALTALVELGWVIVNADTGYSDECQSGAVPKTLIDAMLEISKMMMPREVQRVMAETGADMHAFIAKRTVEMESRRTRLEMEAKQTNSSSPGLLGFGWGRQDGYAEFFPTADAEVRALDAEKSLLVKILRLRWASNPNTYYGGSWDNLVDVVKVFLDGSKVTGHV